MLKRSIAILSLIIMSLAVINPLPEVLAYGSTLAVASTTESNLTLTNKTDVSQKVVDSVVESGLSTKVDGIFLVGICKLSENTRLLLTAEPFKSDETIDLEARQEALEGYTNVGIAVVDNYLNVREEPSTSGEIIGKMLSCNICEVIEESSGGEWLKIKSGSIEGWVASEYILTGEAARELALKKATVQVIVNVNTLNVRSEPNTDSTIWTQANGSEHYDVVEDLGDWVEISLDGSSNGYVAKEYVTIKYQLNTAVKYYPDENDPTQPLRSRIVAYAIKWLGGKYVWGGETLGQGVDCSGFTMQVYKYFGISLTHYSGAQAAEGKSIKRSELQKGDLVFYAKDGTINHVAIYIGDGQVIHARSAKRGICITSIDYRTPVKYVTYLS